MSAEDYVDLLQRLIAGELYGVTIPEVDLQESRDAWARHDGRRAYIAITFEDDNARVAFKLLYPSSYSITLLTYERI